MARKLWLKPAPLVDMPLGLYLAQHRAVAPHDSRLLRLRSDAWIVRGHREPVLAAEVLHRQPRVGLSREADDLASVNRFFIIRPFRWAGL